MRDIVFLDLETTGTSPDTNEIIEIGAVKLCGDEERTFQSLVKPQGQVPYYITRLTGIHPLELKDAPLFHQIKDGLSEFLGDAILVGHNLAFDLSFLAAAGLNLEENPVYDTLEISRVVFPALPEYSLAFLSAYMEVEHSPRHRALDDALATLQVFNRLKDKIASLQKEEIEELIRALPLTGWSFIPLFQEAYLSKAWSPAKIIRKRPFSQIQAKKIAAEAAEVRAVPSLEPKTINALFKSGSALSKSFSSYENRPGQVQMALQVNQAFHGRKNLLAEAGTGTGKSIAYLLPSLFLSCTERKPVVVSTNTINLQEQLMNKDIPGLLHITDLQHLDIANLKGRNNYLCMRRWKNLFSDKNMSREEARLALRVYLWTKECRNGDRGEIQLKGEEEFVWKRINSTDNDCLGENCPHKRDRGCFFYNARERAEKSNLLIINHALLISNMAAGNGVLPEFDYLVIDEAHHLEDVATEHLGFRLKEKAIHDFIEEVKRAIQIYARVDRDDARSASSGVKQSLSREIRAQGALVSDHLSLVKQEIADFYVKVKEYIQGNSRDPQEYEQRVRMTARSRSLPGWKNVIRSGEAVVKSMESLEKEMEQLLSLMEALPEGPGKESGSSLAGIVRESQEIREHIGSFVLSPDSEVIYWASISLGEPVLCAAPLSVSAPLQSHLFSEKSSVVLTSATLTPGGSFDYIQNRLGVPEAEKISIPSPFDYSGSCLVTVAADMPEPDKNGYPEALEQALKNLCLATKGRTLVLFTAHNTLRNLRYRLQPVLDKEGTLLLGQGVDGSAKHLLDQFRSQENTILFGTSSFWEGVDVVGEALSVLVIVKLPFPVPSDPVIAARSEEYKNPFNEYSLPQAILKFKQGFGRLIRSQTDRGVMVVLDSRIKSKYYGRNFLEALPLCPIKFTPVRDTPDLIKSWLGWA